MSDRFVIPAATIRDAFEVIAEALRGLPDPRTAFDPGQVDYVIPRSLESMVRSAAEEVLQMGAAAALRDARGPSDGLSVGVRMRYASGETGEVCWLDDKWVLAYQDTPCRTPRMYHRASVRPEKTK